jgi:hypothetical protein
MVLKAAQGISLGFICGLIISICVGVSLSQLTEKAEIGIEVGEVICTISPSFYLTAPQKA